VIYLVNAFIFQERVKALLCVPPSFRLFVHLIGQVVFFVGRLGVICGILADRRGPQFVQLNDVLQSKSKHQVLFEAGQSSAHRRPLLSPLPC
jgi:hypothetical protein